jgi:hypothetical protein
MPKLANPKEKEAKKEREDKDEKTVADAQNASYAAGVEEPDVQAALSLDTTTKQVATLKGLKKTLGKKKTRAKNFALTKEEDLAAIYARWGPMQLTPLVVIRSGRSSVLELRRSRSR